MRLKLYLPRQKWTIIETLIFFKTVPLAFSSLIPVSFPLIEASLKLWYREKQHWNFLISSTFLNPIIEMNFPVRKWGKVAWNKEYGGCCTCIFLCFIKKILFSNYRGLFHIFPFQIGTGLPTCHHQFMIISKGGHLNSKLSNANFLKLFVTLTYE